MGLRSRLAGLLLGSTIVLFAVDAAAATFRWANDGDANSMDPYTRSETFLLTFTQNFYDPLVRRDDHLKVQPALAESWEQPNPTTWRFHLRHGVKFHDGTPFTADDVVFSYDRVMAPGSQLNAYMQAVTGVKKIDDYTVDFLTKQPDPIFLEEITSWVIMSKKWSETNHAEHAMDLTKSEENYATRHGKWHRAVHPRRPRAGPPHHHAREPGLVGQDAGQRRQGRIRRDRQCRHARCRPTLR